jgi:hypothetical protein
MSATGRGIVLLLAGVAAGPAAWVAQLIFDYALSSYACFPRYTPATVSPPPGWSGEAGVLLAVNLVCLILALAGFAIAFRRLREAGGARGDGASEELAPPGRRRFLAICGIFASLGFAAAILFDTPFILGVPSCWSIAA